MRVVALARPRPWPQLRPAMCVLALTLGLGACGSPSRPVVRPQSAAPPAPTAAAAAQRPVYTEAPQCPRASNAAPRPPVRARQVLQARHAAEPQKLSISNDGLIASTSNKFYGPGEKDDCLKIWSLRDRTLLRTVRDTPALSAMSNVAWKGDSLVLDGTVGVDSADVEMDRAGLLTNKATGRSRATWVTRPWGTDALPRPASRDGFVDLVMSGKTHGLEEPPRPLTLVGERSGGIVVGADETHAAAVAGNQLLVWPLVGGNAKPELVDLALTDETIEAVAVGARGEQLLAGIKSRKDSATRTLLLTRAEGRWTRRALAGPKEYLHHVLVSPDGTLGAVVAYQELVVFDLPAGAVRWRHKPVTTRIGHAPAFTSLTHAARWDPRGYARGAFARSSDSLVVTNADGAIAVFDARTGRHQGALGAELRRVKNAFFTPGGEIAASGDDRLVFWSATEGRVTRTEALAGKASLLDGDVLDTDYEQGDCGDVDWSPLAFRRWEGTRAPKPGSSAAPDAPVTAPWTKGAAPWPWPLPRGGLTKVCVPRGARVEELALEPGLGIISYGESFVGKPRSALDLNNVFVVNLRSGKKVALTDYKTLGAINPQITSDGAYVLAATYSVTSQPTFLVVWDARTGRIVKRDVQITRSEGSAVRYRSTGVDRFFLSPDRRRILLAYGLDAAIYDFPALREQSKFKTSAPVQSARALDARGDAWLLGAQDGVLVRVENGALRATGASPGGGLDSVEIDAAASRAVTVSQDGSVGVWDTKTAALLATLASFDDDEYVAFTPGGAYSGTPEVSDRVGWVFDAPLEGFRFEQFDRVARRADVVRARLSGGGGDLSPIDARPPRIELVRPPPATVNLDVSEIHVRVTSPGRVDAVRAFVEGRPVVARAVCAAEADLSLTLPLMAGSNRVSVVAFDDRGFASNPITFDVTLADSPSAPRAPELYVVAAGVSTYPSLAASYQLDLADDDARAIAAALSAQVGPGKAFSVLHSRLLVDEQVTVASLKEALSALAAMRPEDTAVVFLAGHGVKPKGGDMVFLTSTADATQEGATRGGLGWKEIGERLAAAKGRVLVLLDACHSGDVSQELLVHNGDLAASLVHEQRAGALVFAAAKGRQLSYEGQTSRGASARSRGLTLDATAMPLVTTGSNEAHGYFTGALLNALTTPATDRNADGVIQISELVDDVIARVSTASDGKQTPWVARRELFGDFAIARTSQPAK